MTDLPSLTTIAETAWEFTLNLNKYCIANGLADSFRAAATPEETAEWRMLFPSIQNLQPYAAILGALSEDETPSSPHRDYVSFQQLRLGEIYARVGIKALGAEKVKEFFPVEAQRDPQYAEALEKLATPSLERLCQP